MIIGITGTKKGATGLQLNALEYTIRKLKAREGHHGDCVGADSQAHDIMKELGLRVVIHPPHQSKGQSVL